MMIFYLKEAILLILLNNQICSGQRLNCYSCSSNLQGSYSRNLDCVTNLTTVRSVVCSRGYYCMTNYQYSQGVLTYVRRSCQNPKSDQNPNTNSIPSTDVCLSSYSSNSNIRTNCYYRCNVTKCNKHLPRIVSSCLNQCPDSCDPITGRCNISLSCVQCLSDDDSNCEQKSIATPCPDSSYTICASLRTILLNYNGSALRSTVEKSCMKLTEYARIPQKSCQFIGASTSRYYDNHYLKYICSNFCTTSGCNYRTPGGFAAVTEMSCVVCEQIGSIGRCSSETALTRCPATATHCQSYVSYYVTEDQQYSIASIKRSCATEAVRTECINSTIANSNLQYVICQESCNSSGCNTGWPARPKCVQCDVTNGSFSEQLSNCFHRPQPARLCPSPAFKYCTWMFNNTESSPTLPQRVSRGCSIVDIGTSCQALISSDGKSTQNCQGSCTSSNCNGKPFSSN